MTSQHEFCSKLLTEYNKPLPELIERVKTMSMEKKVQWYLAEIKNYFKQYIKPNEEGIHIMKYDIDKKYE